MATIHVSTEEMEAAATGCTELEQMLEDCITKFDTLNKTLQASMEGQTARAFDEYVIGSAIPFLQNCAQMCAETSVAIIHTCNQFTEADGTLSGTFIG